MGSLSGRDLPAVRKASLLFIRLLKRIYILRKGTHVPLNGPLLPASFVEEMTNRRRFGRFAMHFSSIPFQGITIIPQKYRVFRFKSEHLKSKHIFKKLLEKY